MKLKWANVLRQPLALCCTGSAALALLTAICFRLHAIPSVPAVLFTVVIVAVSLQGRFLPAIFVSLIAVGCLDYFFVAPVFRIAMTGPLDLAALFTYLTTAIVITGLLSRLRKSLRQLRLSEARLAEGERLSRTGSWTWNVSNRANVYWSAGQFHIFGFEPQKEPVSYKMALGRIHPEDLGPFEQHLGEAVRGKKDWEFEFRLVLPDGSTKYVQTIGRPVLDEAGCLTEYVGTVIDTTEQHRSRAALEKAFADVKDLNAELTRTNQALLEEISERQRAQEALRISEQQRANQLAKANEALRGCLDSLAQVPDLDDFLGQVMVSITRYLGATFSTVRMLNAERNRLTLEFVFREGKMLSPIEAEFPERWRSLSLDEQHLFIYQSQPTTVNHLLDPNCPTPPGLREYLIGLGIRTGLIIPLASVGQMLGMLAFYFNTERDFEPEALEIARALATQAGLAIHLTRLARTAKQSAVLEERNRLAGEIHDSLAQIFAGISLQLFTATEGLKEEDHVSRGYINRANDLAHFGLAEARRSALSLRSDIIEDSGLTQALQMLVERSNIPGRLRCTFRSYGFREGTLPLPIQQDLLRIAQEAISNALRHAKPTVVSVALRAEPKTVSLEIRDNGLGIDNSRLESGEGLGISNMRNRARELNAELDIRTAPGRGTSVVVRLPLQAAAGYVRDFRASA